MTLGDVVGLSDSQERLLVRAMQLALAGLAVYGLLTLRIGFAVPAVLALAITFVPAIFERQYDYSMDVGLVLWITTSVFLHTVGSLYLYARFSWYDEVTHTISATVIAGVGYASFRALELHTDEIDVPSEFRGIFIVVFVLAAAVFWEILEFAFGSYFTVYGIDDIVTDMIANTVGAVIVAIAGSGYVDGVVGFLRGRLRARDGA